MRITIVYDNTAYDQRLKADWGFACLLDTGSENILFDTGANGRILMDNMEKLAISPEQVDKVVISHDHWDHTGGLSRFLSLAPVPVYLPDPFTGKPATENVSRILGKTAISDGVYSTGTLKHIEQSLVVESRGGLVVIAGCAHPGVPEILRAASEMGKVAALIGGLHGFHDFKAVENLKTVCATHCTQYQDKLWSLYPDKMIAGGAGQVIEIE